MRTHVLIDAYITGKIAIRDNLFLIRREVGKK
jgi:hypothetical protein